MSERMTADRDRSMPDLDPGTLGAAAAICETSRAPGGKALARALLAARDTHPPATAPTHTQAPSGPQNAKEAS